MIETVAKELSQMTEHETGRCFVGNGVGLPQAIDGTRQLRMPGVSGLNMDPPGGS
jgi:hypothetical protein